MQQFIFLPVATYTAQMVFVKTFSHRNSSGAIRKSSELFRGSQTKFGCCNRDRGKASEWKSLLTGTQSNVKLWPLSNSDTFPLHFGENDRS